jgi:hypothetical protein
MAARLLHHENAAREMKRFVLRGSNDDVVVKSGLSGCCVGNTRQIAEEVKDDVEIRPTSI